MQKRLMPGRLLDDNGCLQEAGYATCPVKEYRRAEVRQGHCVSKNGTII